MAHFPPGQGKPIGFYAVKAALHFISFQFEVLCEAPFAYATFIFYTHFLFLAAAANYAGKLLYYARGYGTLLPESSIPRNGCHFSKQFSVIVLLDVVLVLLY